MTRFIRPLLVLSLLAGGLTVGPAGAADRETLAAVVARPAAGTTVETAAPAVATPAALSSRPAVHRRSPTLNHQRPLNDDLARFTRAF